MEKYFKNLDKEVIKKFGKYLDFIKDTYDIDFILTWWKLTFTDGSTKFVILDSNISEWYSYKELYFYFADEKGEVATSHLRLDDLDKVENIEYLGNVGWVTNLILEHLYG